VSIPRLFLRFFPPTITRSKEYTSLPSDIFALGTSATVIGTSR
jgi:hypothetical protein